MRVREATGRRAVLAGVVLGVVVLAGCTDGGSGTRAGSDSGAAPRDMSAPRSAAPEAGKAADPLASSPGAEAASIDPAAAQRRIVLTAELRLRVADPDRAAQEAQAIARLRGGMVADERTDRALDPSQGRSSTLLTLKVAPAEFDRALDELSRIGAVLSRQRTAKDVTDEVVDVDSRIESQRRSVERTRQLMAKATSITDIVALEGELSRREADLESLLKRQQALVAQTDLSTITVTIEVEPTKPASTGKKDDDEGFVDAVGDAWSAGWHGIYNAGRVVSVVAAAVFPFAAVLFVLWLIERFSGRPVRRSLARVRARGRDRAPADFGGWRVPTGPSGVPPAPPAPLTPPAGVRTESGAGPRPDDDAG